MISNNAKENVAEQEPPKPPRTAFMCFTDAKREEIIQRQKVQDQQEILALVAEEWKKLDDRERAYWDEEARNDKLRFVREKNDFRGVWNVPKRRAKKHPLAPKRPMSAFLKFSQTRRAQVKEENPDMSNTDVSRLLGEMWRNASTQERAPFVDQEERERAVYKEEIRKFREKQAQDDAENMEAHRKSQAKTRREHSVYRERPMTTQPPIYPSFHDHVNYEPLAVEEAVRRLDHRMLPSFEVTLSEDANEKDQTPIDSMFETSESSNDRKCHFVQKSNIHTAVGQHGSHRHFRAFGNSYPFPYQHPTTYEHSGHNYGMPFRERHATTGPPLRRHPPTRKPEGGPQQYDYQERYHTDKHATKGSRGFYPYP